jgi:hypothetical protein
MTSFDYTSRDYLSIREDLFGRASTSIPEWTSRSRSDFGVLMVDLWAYMGDVLHYYVDRAAAESYLNTATQRSSVLAIANLLDYKPLFQTSSTGTVTISASDVNHGSTIVIPANTGFVSPATDNYPIVYFTSTASASMGPSVASVVVSVAEGRYVSSELPVNAVSRVAGVSNGLSSQRFNLYYTGVVASSVKVYVKEGTVLNGVPTEMEYSYVSNLSDALSSSRSFTLEVTADGITQIVFGNGVNGKIPTNGAEVTVSYRRGQGNNGNLPDGYVSAYDAGSNITGTYISSSSAMSGGSDAESIESMRANIPLMFRTQDRAVSVQDFKDLALRAPQVAKATCDATGAPNIMLYVAPYQSDYLTTTSTTISVPATVRTGVLEYFAPRTVVGASVGVSPTISLSPLNITATIYVQDQYVAQWVKEAVESVIDSFFEFEAVSFGQTMSLGDFYRALHSVAGVNYANITRFRFASDSASEVYNTRTVSDLGLIRKGTITITTSGGVTGILV